MQEDVKIPDTFSMDISSDPTNNPKDLNLCTWNQELALVQVFLRVIAKNEEIVEIPAMKSCLENP